MKRLTLALLAASTWGGSNPPAGRQLTGPRQTAEQKQAAIARAVAKRERRKRRNLENRT